MFPALALAALIIEAVAGYPDGLLRRVGHPVTWMGRLIALLDWRWNTGAFSAARRRLHGVMAVSVLLMVAIGAGYAIEIAAFHFAGPITALALLAVLASTLIAQRSLDDHVSAVALALDANDIDAARQAVGKIVGRDTGALDSSSVSRAAIETLAENFSDAVVAPVFWTAVAGLPGGLGYKAVNTADSMIGHKTERYRDFGWAAARLDDLINLPASRLSALWLVIAAALLPGPDPARALATVFTDAGKHKSPNAGWPEAAMAGALGIRLAGPRSYGGVPAETAWMGDGRAQLDVYDIRKALTLYRTACTVQAGVLAALTAGLGLA
jgi:adenosylcobinamide-phosphate synthase